jgi:hypothetical protein
LTVGTDTDGDGDDDATEGFGDSDNDGIPEYLDAIDVPNVLQEQTAISDSYLLEAEPGLQLRLGSIAFEVGRGQSMVGMEDIISIDGRGDSETAYEYNSGLYDFEVSEVPVVGQSVQVVIAQLAQIPENAVYRKLMDSGWQDFVADERNSVSSSAGEEGICPPPGDASYEAGLIAGYWCVQLTIEDGGPNDADNLANNNIVDPGGVAGKLTQEVVVDVRGSGGLMPPLWLLIFGLLAVIGGYSRRGAQR